MPLSRGVLIFWLLLAAGVLGFWLVSQPDEPWALPLALIVVGASFAALIPRLRPVFSAPLRGLRARPALYWLLLLLYLTLALAAWIVPYQPTNGRLLKPVEYQYLLAALWLLVYLLAYDLDRPQARAMGAGLSRSRWSGVLITLTTVWVLFFGAEFWMRVFYITTDAYGFTAMNYHWYKNFYWGRYNSLGYRDYEPIPDAAVRIAVLGDSFAMGHGINDLNDTFPQMLERDLGAGYDVNVIAHSGWDSDVELHYLQTYPLKPDILILSYYLNDIDHLLTDPSQNPDAAFDFPQDPTLYWFVLNFFVPNFTYYNLMQFTSPVRATNFTDRLIGAHLDDDLWARQAWWLNEIVTWTQAEDMRLVVLLWPHLGAVEASTPATVRVRDFFRERDVPVVDMTDALRDQDPRQMVVNRFDSHPGVAAQRLAADQLYRAIRALEAAGSS